MANILVNIEKDIQIGAEDALKWLAGAEQKIQVAPKAVAALGVLLGQVHTVIADVGADASNPLNITLLPAQIADVKAVWPDVVAFAQALGIKL